MEPARSTGNFNVSIQLVSPASGELLLQEELSQVDTDVSIQLVSPTSGEGESTE